MTIEIDGKTLEEHLARCQEILSSFRNQHEVLGKEVLRLEGEERLFKGLIEKLGEKTETE